MTDYEDVFYAAPDGLKLYARDYRHKDASLTILCMHGLTRNSADFESIAPHLNERYRVVSVDQRGRGRSDYDPDWQHYTPVTYVADMWKLLDDLGVREVVLFGTSMGGLMSMMAAMQPGRVKGAIINDIGPVVDPKGLARIKGYVGKTKPAASWPEAAARIKELNVQFYPDFTEDDWMKFARRTFHKGADGVPVLSYDPNISRPMADAPDDAVPPDLWPLFEMTTETPTLVLRGELSDILSAEMAEEMATRHPDCTAVMIPRVGHAPILDEPAAVTAIDAFLADLEGKA